MTDGIGRLSGYGNYGVGGYMPQRKQNDVSQEQNPQEQGLVNNYEETQVDPSKIMDWMAANNNFANVINAPAQVESIVTDPTIEERVAGFMENYEYFMTIIEQEFGEEQAPAVMDVVMDKLMGMTE